MPASDLFVSSYDVEFRLLKTWIVVGKMALFIRGVDQHPDVRKTILYCNDCRGDTVAVHLGRLPLSAMTNCPYGYYAGRWYARAPARHRYQGLRSWSWWSVSPNGEVRQNEDYSAESLLPALLQQPLVRHKDHKGAGILTRDVCIDGDHVLIRGLRRGKLIDDSRVLVDPNTPQYMKGFLDNARLSWEDDLTNVEKCDMPAKQMETPA